MSGNTAITLDPSDLLSKYGFGDGDMTGDLVHAWGLGSYLSEWMADDERWDHPLTAYCNPTALLIELVVEFLLPVLPEHPKSVLQRVYTMHNPVRLEPVCDDNSPDYEELCEQLTLAVEALAPVEVTGEQIDALCDRLFPPRKPGWVKLHAFLTYQHPFIHELGMRQDPAQIGPELQRGAAIRCTASHFLLPPYLDTLAEQHADEALGLAAELLATRASPRMDTATLASVDAALVTTDLLLNR
jgi:hypothetical protein